MVVEKTILYMWGNRWVQPQWKAVWRYQNFKDTYHWTHSNYCLGMCPTHPLYLAK